MEMDGPLPQEASAPCWDFTDDFSKQKNPLEYNYLRNPHMEHYERDMKNACLVLTGTDVTLSDMDAPTIQMVRQREFCATAGVTVFPANVQKDGRLGLAAFYSNDYHYEIYYTEKDGSGRICLSRRIHDLEAVTAEHEVSEVSRKRSASPADHRGQRKLPFLLQLRCRSTLCLSGLWRYGRAVHGDYPDDDFYGRILWNVCRTGDRCIPGVQSNI